MNLFAPPPEDARLLLENFDAVIQNIQPLTSKQLLFLPKNIRALSRQLTNERSKRKLGYMNNSLMLSSYVHYFMRWNLFRLCSVFAAVPENVFSFLQDKSYCLDIGSGPLTVPLALYLSRPELRRRKLTWYCMDTSQSALAIGENLFLSCAARLRNEQKALPWRIIRVKGEIGTQIKHKARFITCANMFNELYWNTSRSPEQEAKKYAAELFAYGLKKENGKPECAVFTAEPGIPRAARFVSLLRSTLLRNAMHSISPCPHEKDCPMDGKRGGKWCHFVLDTKSAPATLKRLSEKAGLPKDRAALSFIFALPQAQAKIPAGKTPARPDVQKVSVQGIRICSDPIALPKGRTGRYACAPWGLTLVIEKKTQQPFCSGEFLKVSLSPGDIKKMGFDRKSGAKILSLE